jgi:hypothetical protein
VASRHVHQKIRRGAARGLGEVPSQGPFRVLGGTSIPGVVRAGVRRVGLTDWAGGRRMIGGCLEPLRPCPHPDSDGRGAGRCLAEACEVPSCQARGAGLGTRHSPAEAGSRWSAAGAVPERDEGLRLGSRRPASSGHRSVPGLGGPEESWREPHGSESCARTRSRFSTWDSSTGCRCPGRRRANRPEAGRAGSGCSEGLPCLLAVKLRGSR